MTKVGELRAQCAYQGGDVPVEIVVKDSRTRDLLAGRKLAVLRCWPDSKSQKDGGTSVFRIEVEIERTAEEIIAEGR